MNEYVYSYMHMYMHLCDWCCVIKPRNCIKYVEMLYAAESFWEPVKSSKVDKNFSCHNFFKYEDTHSYIYLLFRNIRLWIYGSVEHCNCACKILLTFSCLLWNSFNWHTFPRPYTHLHAGIPAKHKLQKWSELQTFMTANKGNAWTLVIRKLYDVRVYLKTTMIEWNVFRIKFIKLPTTRYKWVRVFTQIYG